MIKVDERNIFTGSPSQAPLPEFLTRETDVLVNIVSVVNCNYFVTLYIVFDCKDECDWHWFIENYFTCMAR